MSLEIQFVALLQLLLAAFLSMIIGMNRERHDKDAGLRTHMLVGLGACLFTTLSIYGFQEVDTARIASQIVVGVGFLGAGVIYKGDDKVHALTTAGSIWATAALGMAAGVGAWFLAICMTLLIWTILEVLRKVRDAIAEDDSSKTED